MKRLKDEMRFIKTVDISIAWCGLGCAELKSANRRKVRHCSGLVAECAHTPSCSLWSETPDVAVAIPGCYVKRFVKAGLDLHSARGEWPHSFVLLVAPS